MARAQLDMVRELVSEGKTDEQVVSYFVDRYGEWVLLEPKREGFNWFVWLGPVALLVGGLFVILRQIKQEPAPAPASTEKTATTEAEDPYLQAVRRELDQ
jgi:cytochrome c-type biogenesis protein CcmH